MQDGDMEVVREFLVESYENLDRLDREFLTLEDNPSDQATLASIFRTIHTIKGTCGFLGFGKLESVTHVGENLLSRLRDGQLKLTPEITTALLALVDAVRTMLSAIETTQQEGDGDYTALISRLTSLQSAAVESPAAPAPKSLGQILVDAGKITPQAAEQAVDRQTLGDPRRVGEILVEEGHVQPRDVLQALNAQSDARGAGLAESNIRVDVVLLDKLMNLVGELVLTRNQILQFRSQQKDSGFNTASQRLNLITSELQESVMKTRMQPIGNIWNKLPRVVRDLATACGKQIRVEMKGQGTELDKTIIEAIKDPLTHLVRNSADHGVERPAQRVAAGKPAEGCVSLRAFHEGGQVNIEISDDGAGIDPARVRQKAVQRQMISAEQAARMSDREVLQLIFLPGFSTAEKVTNVSGRGVGMDVVKTNIEKIGGIIDLQSQPGQGTKVRMKIPLTLAIIPALIVAGKREGGEECFAIPQVNLLELVRLSGTDGETQLGNGSGNVVEMVHGAPVFRLRGNLLPLVNLRNELDRQTEAPCGEAQVDGSEGANIVVLQAGDTQFGLVVDSIHDTEEIVVKPLDKQLKCMGVFAGATILGDGTVALILDVLGLGQRANVLGEAREKPRREAISTAENNTRQTLLLFQTGSDERMAIPLSMVGRLEELETKRVEKSGGQEVIQYRGQIMPLIRLSQQLGLNSQQDQVEANTISVVVYSNHGCNVGLVVRNILDIVEDNVVIQRDLRRKGVLGSAVVQDRITDLLDVPAIVGAALGSNSGAKQWQEKS
jgi:two-component system chemotaxis sensor kinase CheA